MSGRAKERTDEARTTSSCVLPPPPPAIHPRRRCAMRASVAPNRHSQIPGSVSSAAAVANLAEKKKEFEAVAALDQASAQFLKRIEDLGDDFDVMADVGIGAHPPVLLTDPRQSQNPA